MVTTERKRIAELLDRLARISAADDWSDDLNPTQWTALSYLARANRFSRSPSQVADFMAATRGTVSQTLKTLAKKGYIQEARSAHDKRSISYSVSKQGDEVVRKTGAMEQALSVLHDDDALSLLTGLECLAHNALRQRALRPFGICERCSHHQKRARGGYCRLLNQPLSSIETKQICHEFTDDGNHRDAVPG